MTSKKSSPAPRTASSRRPTGGEQSIRKQLGKAERVERPEPLPLSRKTAPPQPFPVKALGKILGPAADAIIDVVRCPDGIAGNSVLAAATLAAQPHADVVHPITGQSLPLSEFFVTVAVSGDRKTTADRIALGPIGLMEAELHDKYEASSRVHRDALEVYNREREVIKRTPKLSREERTKRLTELGPAPRPPLAPVIKTSDPTLEGLQKLMAIGQPSMGLFTDEGGTFIGGHSFQDDFRVRTAAGLSSFWDGSPVSRVRGGDGWTTLRNRRLTMHIMIQPGVAEMLLADPTLQSQGLPSRFLVSAPASLAGTRFPREPKASTKPALKKYETAILKLMRKPYRLARIGQAELNPLPIRLSAEAVAVWRSFAIECEHDLGPGGRLEPVRAFANKLAEHALRMAAVLALVDKPDATLIHAETFERAVSLARYYADEALRLFEHAAVSVQMQRAEMVRKWLLESGRTVVYLAEVYQLGPNPVRTMAAARETMGILEQHHWVAKIDGGTKINGKHRRVAWQIFNA